MFDADSERHEIDKYVKLYNKFYPGAYCLALSITHCADLAESAVLEAFRIIWQRRGRYHFDHKGGFCNMFLLITRQQAIILARHSQRQRSGLECILPEKTAPDHVTETEKAELYERINNCYDKLADSDRELVRLRVMEKRKINEISKSLSISRNRISPKIQQALDRIRQCVENGA